MRRPVVDLQLVLDTCRLERAVERGDVVAGDGLVGAAEQPQHGAPVSRGQVDRRVRVAVLVPGHPPVEPDRPGQPVAPPGLVERVAAAEAEPHREHALRPAALR